MYRAKSALLVLTLALGIGALLLGVAQWMGDAAAQTVSAPLNSETLEDTNANQAILQVTLDELPTPPVTLRLLRITLEPGATVPAHTHPGPEFGFVESGTLTVMVEGDVRLSLADGESDVAAPQREQFELEAGDLITYLPESAMTFGNGTTEPVAILAAVILPIGHQHPPGIVYIDGQPAADAFEGVSSQVLGDGLAETLPPGPFSVEVERLSLAAGESIPASSGPTLMSLESGTLEFGVAEGLVQVTRTAAPGLQPAAEPGQVFALDEGDAAFFPGGMAEVTLAETAVEFVVLRLGVTGDEAAPVATPGATPVPVVPGVIEIITPESEPTPEPETGEIVTPGQIVEGATVVVNETSVRLRSEPTTESEILTGLDVGQVMTVVGPPVEADGFVWWPVESPIDPSISGWVAADFIDLAE